MKKLEHFHQSLFVTDPVYVCTEIYGNRLLLGSSIGSFH